MQTHGESNSAEQPGVNPRWHHQQGLVLRQATTGAKIVRMRRLKCESQREKVREKHAIQNDTNH